MLTVTSLLTWAQRVAGPYREGVDLLVAFGTLLTAGFTLLLAAGTFVLANYTLRSVRSASGLALAENTRHQQNLGPILTIKALDEAGPTLSFLVRNVGLGPAQNIYLMIRGQTNTGEIEAYLTHTILNAGPGATWEIRPPEEAAFSFAPVFRASCRLVAVLSYFDLFGNEYRTVTTDIMDQAQLAWIRTKTLYPDRNNIERYLDVHEDPVALLNSLVATSIEATVEDA